MQSNTLPRHFVCRGLRRGNFCIQLRHLETSLGVIRRNTHRIGSVLYLEKCGGGSHLKKHTADNNGGVVGEVWWSAALEGEIGARISGFPLPVLAKDCATKLKLLAEQSGLHFN
eukprot:INCI11905.2.p1 GENE.INCI11905.2~~INCI11905.2.p1  ORF type:complete len:114 (+),score=6.06 INCI11905.2:80-421(+)